MPVLDYTHIDAGLPKGPLGIRDYMKLPRRVRKTLARRGTLDYTWYVQNTGYWCGPTTAQMLLKARGVSVSQQTLATEMGTDADGTDYIGLMVKPLNKRLNNIGYYAKYSPTKEQLWSAITDSIDSGYGMGCNIVTTPGTYNPTGYPSYRVWHYVPCFGYSGSGSSRKVFCADSANFSGVKSWWVSLDVMHGLVVQKGVAPIPRVSQNLLGMSDADLSVVRDNFAQLGPT